MVTILMMSGKIVILGLLKIKIFWDNDYDVITYVPDVTEKKLSRDPYYIVYVAMWSKFCNTSIPMREVIITLIL